MKTEEIPFNMKIYYDDQLDEIAEDFEEMEKGISFLKNKYEEMEDESTAGVILLAQIGTFLRILKQLPEAESIFTKAVEIAQKLNNQNLLFALDLRIALINLSKKKLIPAYQVLEDRMNEIKTSGDKKLASMIDFILFHQSRIKFYEGALSESLNLMTRAMEKRLVKGDLEGIDQAQKAMQIINKKMS